MEGRRNNKRKKDRMEEGIQGERMKEKNSLLLALNWSDYSSWSSCLWNRRQQVEGLVSLFSLPEPHSSLLFSLQSSSSRSFSSPVGLQFISCVFLGLHQLGATHTLPSCSVLSQMLGALGAAMGQFSPLLGRVFPGNAVLSLIHISEPTRLS